MRALALTEVPDANIAAAVAADQLSLIRVDDHVVHGAAMVVVALYRPPRRVPDSHRAVLGAGDHPLAFTVERDARNIASVAFEGEKGIRVGTLNIIELDRMVSGCGEETLVGRDTEPVDLRIGMRNGARTYARKRLPEAAAAALAARRIASGIVTSAHRIVWS